MNINAKATPLRGVCDGRLATPQGTLRSSDASDVSSKAFLKVLKLKDLCCSATKQILQHQMIWVVIETWDLSVHFTLILALYCSRFV